MNTTHPVGSNSFLRVVLRFLAIAMVCSSCHNRVAPSGPPLALKQPFTTQIADTEKKRAIVFPQGTYTPIYADDGGTYYTAPGQIIEVGLFATPGGVFIPNKSNSEQRFRFYRHNDWFLKTTVRDSIPFATEPSSN
jgi:hypothetical protein